MAYVLVILFIVQFIAFLVFRSCKEDLKYTLNAPRSTRNTQIMIDRCINIFVLIAIVMQLLITCMVVYFIVINSYINLVVSCILCFNNIAYSYLSIKSMTGKWTNLRKTSIKKCLLNLSRWLTFSVSIFFIAFEASMQLFG